MRKIIQLSCVGAVVLLLTGAGAALGQGKIGFVLSAGVLQWTQEGQVASAKLNELVTQKQQAFEAKSKELQALQDDLAAKSRTLNAEARSSMEATIGQKQIELKRFQEDAQVEMNQKQTELLQQMSEKVQVVIDDYAAKNGYTAIFQRDETQQIYVDPSLDITEDIIRIYNEKYPSAAAPAAAPQNP